MATTASSSTLEGDVVQAAPQQGGVGSSQGTTVMQRDPRHSIASILNPLQEKVTISIHDPFKGWSHFTIERALICRSSRLFRHYFGLTRYIRTYIKTGDPEAYGLYIDWLATGDFPTKARADQLRESTPVVNDDRIADEDYGFLIFARLYVLSHDVRDPIFGDVVMYAFIDAVREVGLIQNRYRLRSGRQVPTLPGPRCVHAVYSNIPGEDRMKNFLIEIYAGAKERMLPNQIAWRPERFERAFVHAVVLKSRPHYCWIWGGSLHSGCRQKEKCTAEPPPQSGDWVS